jgi:hypothetical protein
MMTPYDPHRFQPSRLRRHRRDDAPSAAGQNTGIDLSPAVGSPLIGGGQNALGVPPTDTTALCQAEMSAISNG